MPLKGTVWRVFPLIALIALGAFFHSTPGSAQTELIALTQPLSEALQQGENFAIMVAEMTNQS